MATSVCIFRRHDDDKYDDNGDGYDDLTKMVLEALVLTCLLQRCLWLW